MAISCNSWFTIWIIIELNLITFIPVIIFFNKFSKEISFKYFIIQTIRSSILLLSSNSILINLNYNILNFIIIIINLTILLKIGAAPFHLWFINLIKNLNWINCLIISTWQKFIPLTIFRYIYLSKLNYLIILISSIIGAIYGLNHQSIRIILRYSSINHIRWILLNLIIREYLWILYFISYSLINISIILSINIIKIYFINQFYIINNYKFNKIFLLINLISIRGLPPIFGFIIKWITIYYLNWENIIFITIIIIIISILTFTFYIRIIISFLLNNSINNKLIIFNKFLNLNNLKLKLIFFINFLLNLWILRIWIF